MLRRKRGAVAVDAAQVAKPSRLEALRHRAYADPPRGLRRGRKCGCRKIGVSIDLTKFKRIKTRCKRWFGCRYCNCRNNLAWGRHMFGLLLDPQLQTLYVGRVSRDFSLKLADRIRDEGGRCRCFAQGDGTYFVVSDIPFQLGDRKTSPWAEKADNLTAIERTLDAIESVPELRPDWLKGRNVVHGSQVWSLPEVDGDMLCIDDDNNEDEDVLTQLLGLQGCTVKFLGADEIPGLDGMITAKLPEEAQTLDAACNLAEWSRAVGEGWAKPEQVTWERPPPDLFESEAVDRWKRRQLLALALERRRKRDAKRERIRRKREDRGLSRKPLESPIMAGAEP